MRGFSWAGEANGPGAVVGRGGGVLQKVPGGFGPRSSFTGPELKKRIQIKVAHTLEHLRDQAAAGQEDYTLFKKLHVAQIKLGWRLEEGGREQVN